MLILIPWKPVVLLVGFMAALVLVGYFVPFLLERREIKTCKFNLLSGIFSCCRLRQLGLQLLFVRHRISNSLC